MKTVRTALSALALAAFLAASGPASAFEEATATASVHMRAGPGTEFPSVVVVPNGAYVVVHGCVEGFRWCDTSWRDERGWVYSTYLASVYGSRHVPIADYGYEMDLPVVAFGFGYWEEHYHTRSWYRDRWWRRGDLYSPLESHRNEYGSSYWYQHRR